MTRPEIILQVKPDGASEPCDVRLRPEFANAMLQMLVKNKGVPATAAFLRMSPKMILQELSTVKGASEPDNEGLKALEDAGFKALESADAFWKKLVNDIGEPEAKHLMQNVMNNKKTGRRGELPLFIIIFCYIRWWGLHESDGKIAKRIFESKPYYAYCDSGELAVVNDWLTEEQLLWDQTIVKRTPINKGLPAIKKQVERIRRWLIEEKILPKEYAPKSYYLRSSGSAFGYRGAV